jgi:hypothetical protein
MKARDYHDMLYEAKQDLARHLVRRQKLDQKIAHLHAVVRDLQNLCAERDRKQFEQGIDRLVKAHLKKGITEFTRVILEEKFFPITAGQLKQELEAKKLDIGRYANPLAVIHTVLTRLVQAGEVKVVPQKDGKKAYQWISTTEKMLSELRQPGQPTNPDSETGKVHR